MITIVILGLDNKTQSRCMGLLCGIIESSLGENSMAYEENLEQSKEYIKNFCEEYFKLPVSNESIDKLKTFDFIELWEKKDTTFGYTGIPDKLSEFDPDRSNLAKNLYFIIWGDVLPKTKAEFILSKESKAIDTNGDYCGETLSTFRTLFDKTALTEKIYEDTE